MNGANRGVTDEVTPLFTSISHAYWMLLTLKGLPLRFPLTSFLGLAKKP